MEVENYHFTQGPKSQVWHGCLHDSTFCRWGLRLVLRVGSNYTGYKPHVNGFLRLKSWGFAFMLGPGTPCQLALSYAHDIYQGNLGATKINRAICKMSQKRTLLKGLYIKSSLEHLVSKDNFKSWVKLLGPPHSILLASRELLVSTHHLKSPISLCKARWAHH